MTKDFFGSLHIPIVNGMIKNSLLDMKNPEEPFNQMMSFFRGVLAVIGQPIVGVLGAFVLSTTRKTGEWDETLTIPCRVGAVVVHDRVLVK